MTVDEYADALGSSSLELVQEGNYCNCLGQVGYRAIYRTGRLYLWFSVSSMEARLAADEVRTAITALERWIARSNPYLNKKGHQGFEATVHSGGTRTC
jgi:hypothetical protein